MFEVLFSLMNINFSELCQLNLFKEKFELDLLTKSLNEQVKKKKTLHELLYHISNETF